MSLTQAQILPKLVNEYHLGISGTASSGTTSTIVDATNMGGQYSGGRFPNGSPVRIVSTTDGLAPLGESRRKSALNPASGTLTVEPVLSAVVGSGDIYVLSDKVDHIDRLIEGVNRTLQRRISYRAKTPLTYVPDGDLAASAADIATYWTAAAGTPSYVSLAMPEVLGKRVVQVTHTSTDTLTSQTIAVEPGSTWDFLTYIRAATDGDTAAFSILDITNTATLTPAYSDGTGSTTNRSFTKQAGTVDIPATCDRIAFRLTVSGSGTMSAQMARLIAAPDDAVEYATQSHLLVNADVDGFFLGEDFVPIQHHGVQYDDRGWGTVIRWQGHPGFPVYYGEVLYYPALASDADSTDAPEEALLLGAAIEVYQTLVSTQHNPEKRNALLSELNRLERLWESTRVSRQRSGRTVTIRRALAPGTYA